MVKTDIIAETAALGQLRHEIRKQQRAVMRKITSRDMKIAALQKERAALCAELINVSTEYAVAWATRSQPVIPDTDDDVIGEADDEEGAA